MMDLNTPVDLGKLTAVEAVELSRMLDEKWGAAQADAEDGDLLADFILPLLAQRSASLAAPSDHVADVRRRLAGRMAA